MFKRHGWTDSYLSVSTFKKCNLFTSKNFIYKSHQSSSVRSSLFISTSHPMQYPPVTLVLFNISKLDKKYRDWQRILGEPHLQWARSSSDANVFWVLKGWTNGIISRFSDLYLMHSMDNFFNLFLRRWKRQSRWICSATQASWHSSYPFSFILEFRSSLYSIQKNKLTIWAEVVLLSSRRSVNEEKERISLTSSHTLRLENLIITQLTCKTLLLFIRIFKNVIFPSP